MTAWRTPATSTRASLSLGRRCGQTALQPERRHRQRLQSRSRRSRARDPRHWTARPSPTPALSGRHARHQSADGRAADRVATVSRRRAWRRHRHRAAANGGGVSFSSPTVVASVNAFDQGTTDTSFRTNAFPDHGVRRRRPPVSGLVGARIRAVAARPVSRRRPDRAVRRRPTEGPGRRQRRSDSQDEPGHQIMPALTFAQGKLQLVYYDLREDVSQLFGPYVDELPILAGPPPRVRHTVDVWAAQADPGANPSFTAFRLSQYRSGGVPGSTGIQQLEFSPPNLPIFRAGTSPFMGDYLDVATEAPFVRNGSTWSFNTAADGEPRLSRHLDGQSRYPASRPTAAGPTTRRPILHSRGRSTSAFDPTPVDSGVRAGSGRDAQSEYLHLTDHTWTRRRGGGQLTPAQPDIAANLPGLRPEQRHDDPELPADDRQPAGAAGRHRSSNSSC